MLCSSDVLMLLKMFCLPVKLGHALVRFAGISQAGQFGIFSESWATHCARVRSCARIYSEHTNRRSRGMWCDCINCAQSEVSLCEDDVVLRSRCYVLRVESSALYFEKYIGWQCAKMCFTSGWFVTGFFIGAGRAEDAWPSMAFSFANWAAARKRQSHVSNELAEKCSWLERWRMTTLVALFSAYIASVFTTVTRNLLFCILFIM